MTIEVPKETREAAKFLAAVERIYRQAARLFEDAMEEVKAAALKGEITRAKANELSNEYRRAALLFLAEKQAFAHKAKEERGIVNQYALDLEAARTEVRRRMARLRWAAENGELSE